MKGQLALITGAPPISARVRADSGARAGGVDRVGAT